MNEYLSLSLPKPKESFREVNGGQNCTVWRPFLLEVIPDGLGQEEKRCQWGYILNQAWESTSFTSGA